MVKKGKLIGSRIGSESASKNAVTSYDGLSHWN